jgi:hypothetical protein
MLLPCDEHDNIMNKETKKKLSKEKGSIDEM